MSDQSNKTTVYDAIVVGSGANGGVAAMELAQRNVKTLVIEAGPQLDPARALGRPHEYGLKRLYRQFISKRQPTQALHPAYWECNPDLFVDDKDNPYTHPEEKPFHWIRGRQVGGRSLTWGGITLRLSDFEFAAASHDGFGVDWPIRHADLAPYYAKLERFFQVHGSVEALPQLPDGEYLSPSPFTPAEKILKQMVESRWPDRRVIISRGVRSNRVHKPTPDAPWPKLSSPGTTLRVALASGHATLRANAIVTHLLFDPNTRKARGVAFIDRKTQQRHEARARLIVLCASTIETLRILLASTSERQPYGFEDQSGLLGTHLMDHVGASMNVFMPDIPAPLEHFELVGSDGVFIPRFRNIGVDRQRFIRGYGIWGGLQRHAILPDALRKTGPGAVGFLVAHGEMLPRKENSVRLDDAVVDAWGIPVPHINCAWSDNELAMVDDMQNQIRETAEVAGGQCLTSNQMYRLPPLVRGQVTAIETAMAATQPGLYVHELGGAPMGHHPDTSVVSGFNQLWGAPNVLVTDGACWVSSAWQNPTLTEMAITSRACLFAAEELNKLNL